MMPFTSCRIYNDDDPNNENITMSIRTTKTIRTRKPLAHADRVGGFQEGPTRHRQGAAQRSSRAPRVLQRGPQECQERAPEGPTTTRVSPRRPRKGPQNAPS
eukprot:7300602-Pyramimonas_sp.AAC.1